MQKQIRKAAEMVAFDVLDPALRSRGAPQEKAKGLYADEVFRAKMRSLFSAEPAERLVVRTLEDALERILALEEQEAGTAIRPPPLLAGSTQVSTRSGATQDVPKVTVGVFLPIVARVYDPNSTPEPVARLSIKTLQHETRNEYVEIANEGTAGQTMTGWRIHSEIGPQWFDFPAGFVLAAGATVRVHSGPDAFEAPPSDLLWQTSYVWLNEGDKAVLYDDGGQIVDQRCYGTGCP